MDEDTLKEKFELAKKIAENYDEPFKTEGFKIIFKYLLRGSFSTLTSSIESEIKLKDKKQDTSDEFLSKKKKLAEKCKISIEELDDIIQIKDTDVELLVSFSGKDSVQQVSGTLIILLSFEMILGIEWVPSVKLKEILRDANISDKSGNFAQNLKAHSDLFRLTGKSNMVKYTLTSNKGRSTAIELVKKLAKGE